MGKKRADILLFEKGLAESREKAKRIIMEGIVFIGDKRIDKPGQMVSLDSSMVIKENPIRYVSRGGIKLEKAIGTFALELKNQIAMDIGASTGGFTDCMLKNGAKTVYAVDVGYGQLDWNLRNDPRVIVKERTNIRKVTQEDIGQLLDIITIDVSFISLKLVLPVAKKLIKEGGRIIALIKPQFEVGKGKVGKGGIVRDKGVHKEVIICLKEYCNGIQLNMSDLDFSPITGSAGNIEYLSNIVSSNTGNTVSENKISKIIESAHQNLYGRC